MKVHSLDSDHLGLVEEPNVAGVAEIFLESLHRAERQRAGARPNSQTGRCRPAALKVPETDWIGQYRESLWRSRAYYDLLPQRLKAVGIQQIEEDINVLHRLEILVDGSSPTHYLLQIFMREMSKIFKDPQAGPLFIELIRRKGDKGFGAGNFRACSRASRSSSKSGRARAAR